MPLILHERVSAKLRAVRNHRVACLGRNSFNGGTVLGSPASAQGFALSKLHHRSELRIAVIAAIALMIAQVGAMAHAYTHVPGMRSPTALQSSPGSHDYCSDCLAYAPLLLVAGTPRRRPSSRRRAAAWCCMWLAAHWSITTLTSPFVLAPLPSRTSFPVVLGRGTPRCVHA